MPPSRTAGAFPKAGFEAWSRPTRSTRYGACIGRGVQVQKEEGEGEGGWAR